MSKVFKNYVYGLKWQSLSAKNKFSLIGELANIAKEGIYSSGNTRETESGFQVGLTTKENQGKYSAASAIANDADNRNSIFLLQLSEDEYYFLIITNGRIAESSDEVKDKLGVFDSLESELEIHEELTHKLIVDESLKESSRFTKIAESLEHVEFVRTEEVISDLDKHKKKSKINSIKSIDPKLIVIVIIAAIASYFFFGGEDPAEQRRKEFEANRKQTNANAIEVQKKRRKEKLLDEFLAEREEKELVWLSNITAKPLDKDIIEKISSLVKSLPSNLNGWQIQKLTYRNTPSQISNEASYPAIVEVRWRRLDNGSVNSIKSALASKYLLKFDSAGNELDQYIQLSFPPIAPIEDPMASFGKFGQVEIHNIKSMLQVSSLTWDLSNEKVGPIAAPISLPKELTDSGFNHPSLIPYSVYESNLQGVGLTYLESAYIQMNRYSNYVVTGVSVDLTGEKAFTWKLSGFLLGDAKYLLHKERG